MAEKQKATGGGMVLRRATMDDAAVLFEWRNDPVTRANSLKTFPVGVTEHEEWLSATLADTRRQLWIAEERGSPVGSVRVDRNGSEFRLSWTVAPTARARGVGGRMVARVVESLGEAPLRAEVKVGNLASVHIAQRVGLLLDREEGGVLHFVRPGMAQNVRPRCT